MQIFVGSDNQVKIQAVKEAVKQAIASYSQTKVNQKVTFWSQVQVIGVAVPSGVSAQPRTDEETQQGAINRAKNALKKGLNHHQTEVILGVGLEGGVLVHHDELWSTVWAAVIDQANNLFTANGARFKVPTIIAQKILAGAEMGPVVSQLFNGADIRHTRGMIGVVTNDFVTRTQEYAAIARLALGLWSGKDWEKNI